MINFEKALRETLLNMSLVWMAGRLNLQQGRSRTLSSSSSSTSSSSSHPNGVTINQLLNLVPFFNVNVDEFCEHTKRVLEEDLVALPKEQHDLLDAQVDHVKRVMRQNVIN